MTLTPLNHAFHLFSHCIRSIRLHLWRSYVLAILAKQPYIMHSEIHTSLIVVSHKTRMYAKTCQTFQVKKKKHLLNQIILILAKKTTLAIYQTSLIIQIHQVIISRDQVMMMSVLVMNVLRMALNESERFVLVP